MTNASDDALAVFIANVERANHALSHIQDALDDHLGFVPEDIHWSHAGDATWIADKLTEIVEGLSS